jgi:hypothetical protein
MLFPVLNAPTAPASGLHDAAKPGGSQAVLVVDRRVRHQDEAVTFADLGHWYFDYAALDALGGAVVLERQ